MFHSLVTIPLQIVCQLVTPENNVAVNTSFDLDTQVAPVYNSTGSTTFALDTPVTKQPTVVPDGYTAFPDIGVAYKYQKGPMTWNDARKHCIANNSSLAELDSTQKIARALELNTTERYTWIGIHRLFNKDGWTSAKTGLHFLMLPWSANSYVGTSSYTCIVFDKSERGIRATTSDTKHAMICEIPLSTS